MNYSSAPWSAWPPIISLRWRRIIFIETTWDRFQVAQEINDLYALGTDGLFVTLKEMGIAPGREAGVEYVVDLIPCRDGTLAIALGERPAPGAALRFEAMGRSQDNVKRIVEAVERLGGACLLKDHSEANC